MMTVMRSPAELVDTFRASGLKVTPQRRLLFELLDGNCSHPTADELFTAASSRMPGISLRTVYQTLADLGAMGEIRQLSIGSGPTRFDPNVTDHHHVVCDGCGAVTDVYVDGTQLLTICGAPGFRTDTLSIVFHGTCASCAAT
jgi:Fur family transcriptional regulator, stress-responsive regulator